MMCIQTPTSFVMLLDTEPEPKRCPECGKITHVQALIPKEPKSEADNSDVVFVSED